VKVVPDRADVLRALARLDALLERAVAAADAAYGSDARRDPHRGLYVAPDEVARLLGREPGASVLGGVAAAGAADAAWAPFAGRLGLAELDLGILLVALAPEVDLRYERLYAYLQDDVTRKRPTVELVLDLLCETAAEKLDARARFAADAPLVAHGLVRLVAEAAQPDPPLLARAVRLDEQLVELLLGAEAPDGQLEPFARFESADATDAPDLGIAEADEPLRLHFYGPAGSGRLAAARRLAADRGAPLLVVDLPRTVDADPDLERLPALFLRAALLRDALVHVTGVDVLASPERAAAARRLEAALRRHPGPVVLAGTEERLPPDLPELVGVAFAVPDAVARRALWHAALRREGIDADSADVEALAGHFRLTGGRIARAAAGAARAARVQGSSPTAADLFAAARAQSGAALGALARKITPRYAWDDFVLPQDRLAQLQELSAVVRHRPLVYDEWGFERRLSLGKGLNVLFAGPSGTGKTMAAEILAGELGLDLYAIDLAGVVSKYIGETEKNLSRIFAAAETANAILFFDEADALFGKRTEVRDSHDRYANVEISYLLQRLEAHEGIVILASNLRKNMDEAFVRRLHATIEFPFPDEQHRRRIWETIWPRETPLADDLDFATLARRFELAGGSIRNVALAAAFLAADDGRVVTNEHVLRAIRRELQKIGKVLTESELRA
jgi:AAA+ superfamily predicted ATPase